MKEYVFLFFGLIFATLVKLTSPLATINGYCARSRSSTGFETFLCDLYVPAERALGVPPFALFFLLMIVFLILFVREARRKGRKWKSPWKRTQ